MYQNIDPESKVVCWYVRFELRTGHFFKQEKSPQSHFFNSPEDAQLFCEIHEQAF
jgi:hypothetical protein